MCLREGRKAEATPTGGRVNLFGAECNSFSRTLQTLHPGLSPLFFAETFEAGLSIYRASVGSEARPSAGALPDMRLLPDK